MSSSKSLRGQLQIFVKVPMQRTTVTWKTALGLTCCATLASDGMQNATDIINLSRARLAATEVHLRSCGVGVTNVLRMCDRLVPYDVHTAAGINPAPLEAQKAGDCRTTDCTKRLSRPHAAPTYRSGLS
jgi:hypothetical protein